MAEKDKIAEEIMSEDELDKVSGGNVADLADDSRFLNTLLRGRPGQCDRYGQWRVRFNTEEIYNAWRSVGVDCYMPANDRDILYKIDGKPVSREEAWAHAEKVVGKHFEKRIEWDWDF